MMSGHDTDPIFLNKKNKDMTSRTLATPRPLAPHLLPITSHFCFALPPQSGRHMCITPYWFISGAT